MRVNRLKEIWQQGGAAINGWLHIPHSYAAELMAHAGWDSLTIDLQHGPVGYDGALDMLVALSTTDVVPLARVPWNEPGIIMKMLDAGCYGIICPMVNTAEQARQFVAACRYPPVGARSIGPNRALLYGGADYIQSANDTVVTMAMIETKEAMDNLDAILDTPGLDGVYIGPSDLGQSLTGRGVMDPTDPTVVAAIDRVLDGTRRRGQVAGIHTGGVDYARKMVEQGFGFVTIVADSRILLTAARQMVEATKGTRKAAAAGPSGPY
jgi:4-hydroxy-2-oxoheptanedioate aldolase